MAILLGAEADLVEGPTIDGWREWAWTLDSQGPLSTRPLAKGQGTADGAPPGVARYEVVRRLGRGGMSDVWLARDRVLQREVALKLGRSDDPDVTGQFALEAQITSQLDHPNIPPVYDAGHDDLGRPFVTSKLIRGHEPVRSLVQRLAEGDAEAEHAYSLAHRVQVVLQVAGALAYAHKRCVVHQDVKPDNIVLGHYGEVYLLDWGVATVRLACSTGDPLSLAGEGALEARSRADWIQGTPVYMAPEQITGQGADALSDVYSLCAVLYELIALRHYLACVPGADDFDVLVRAIRSRPPVAPHELQLGAGPPPPRDLSELCIRGLAKEPRDRFASAEELRDALQAWLDQRA